MSKTYMHGQAFRVGRAELLAWLNNLLEIDYEKVAVKPETLNPNR